MKPSLSSETFSLVPEAAVSGSGAANPIKKKMRSRRPKMPVRLAWGSVAVLVCCLLGCMLVFLPVLHFPGIPGALAAACFGAAVVTLAAAQPRIRKPFLLGALALWLLLASLYHREILQGAMHFANICIEAYLAVYPEFGSYTLANDPIPAQACAQFLLFACSLWGAWLAWAVVWRRSLAACLLPTLPFFAFTSDLFGLPAPLPAILLLAGWLALLLKGQGGPKTTGRGMLRALAAAAAVMVLIVAIVPPSAYEPWTPVFKIRRSMDNAIHTIQMGLSIGTAAGTLPGAPLSSKDNHVALGRTGNLRYSSGVALRVKGQFNGSHFLRGFSASEYTGRAWRQQPEDAWDTMEPGFQPLLYPILSGSGFRATQVGLETGTLTIQLEDANPDYLYTPYLIQGFEAVEPRFHQDAWASSPEPVETYGVRYPIAPDDADFNNLLGGLLYFTQHMVYSEYGRYFWIEMDGEEGEPTFSVYQAQVSAEDMEAGRTQGEVVRKGRYGLPKMDWEDTFAASSFYSYALQDIIGKQAGPGDAPDLEDPYVESIREAYTRLPNGLGDTLRGLAAEAGIPLSESKWDWAYLSQLVSHYVRTHAEYSMKPGRQPANRDFVEYFLTESQKGYCVHFASAGATMLRALGVPARYVEGYVISNPNKDPEKWTEVPAKNAHAWVEVWLPDIGWIPVEMTPGGGESRYAAAAQPSAATPARPEEPAAPSTPPAESVPQPSASSPAPEASPVSNPASALHLPVWFRAVAGVVLFLGAVLAGVALRSRWLRRRRAKRFAHPNPNLAAQAYYEYLEELADYGCGPSGEAERIAGKAKFSPHTITPEELNHVKEEVRRHRKDSASLPYLSWRLRMWLRGL